MQLIYKKQKSVKKLMANLLRNYLYLLLVSNINKDGTNCK